jgi:tetratricopeptide (TPR) repeat protein
MGKTNNHYKLSMLKLHPSVFKLSLIISTVSLPSLMFAPNSIAAVNSDLESARRSTELYVQYSPCGPGIPTIQCYDMIRRRREQEQKEQDARPKPTPQQIRQEEERQEQARQASEQRQAQEKKEQDRLTLIELEQKGDYIALGKFKGRNQDFVGAMAAFQRAIALNQQPAFAYLSIGHIKEKKNDLAAAMANYNQSIALDPKYPLAYIARGSLKKRLKDLAGATQDYNQALRLSGSTYSIK